MVDRVLLDAKEIKQMSKLDNMKKKKSHPDLGHGENVIDFTLCVCIVCCCLRLATEYVVVSVCVCLYVNVVV